jgi:hypothetical protein
MSKNISCPICRDNTKIFNIYGDKLSIKGNCCICFSENIDLIILYCGHIVICNTCYDYISISIDDNIEFDIYSGEEENYLILNIERIVPNLGDAAYSSYLSLNELRKLYEWINNNNIINCNQILENFNDVIEALEIIDNNIIRHFKNELFDIVYENI